MPLLLLVGGMAGGIYVRELRPDIDALFAWGLVGVFSVGAVLLSLLGKESVACERCGTTQAMSPEEVAETDRHEQSLMEQRVREEMVPVLRSEMRPALEAELRGDVERRLRPEIERNLRPALEQEARAQVERDLRPRITDELRAELTSLLRGQLAEELRPIIEKEVEATLRPKLEQQIRASLPKTAAPATAPARPSTVTPQSTPARADTKPPTASPAAAAPAAKEGAPSFAAVGVTTDPHARAQRKARVIVSDIQLYNRDLVEKAARSNDPFKMLDTVWNEAVKSYDESVPEDIRKSTNYLTEAFEALMNKMRKDHSAST